MNGTRNTIQRELVLAAVRELKNHPTPEQVYEHIAAEYPNISRSTVYRNLVLLCESGTLQRVRVPDAADHVDHTLSPHYHIYCRECGNVSDVDMPYISDFTSRINNTNGYNVERCDILFTGICPHCKNLQVHN